LQIQLVSKEDYVQAGLVVTENQIETFLPEIKQFSLFRACDKPTLLNLFSGARMQASKHREVLYKTGEPATKFSLVLRGAYKLIRTTPRGDDVIVYFAAPGDAIAALVMAQENALYPVSAIAMGPSLVLEIPRATYVAKWMRHHDIVLQLQGLLYNRMVLLQDEKLLNKSPLDLKIAHLLLQLTEKYSAESDGILPIPLTRREIADSLGASVESVIRIMSDWTQKKIIATSEQHIEVLEAGRIAEMIDVKEKMI
jgi:CRP/FNR family transcriptional regulator